MAGCPAPQPPPAPAAPLPGRRLRTKMVVFSRRRQLPHTPPHPPGSDGSRSPKMPAPVPPCRQRRHPSRIPRLPSAAGGGAAGGSEGKAYGGVAERKCQGAAAFFTSPFCFPPFSRHPKPPTASTTALAPRGSGLGEGDAAEGETLPPLKPSGTPPRLRRKIVRPRGRESLGTRRHFHCSLRPTLHAGCEPLLPSHSDTESGGPERLHFLLRSRLTCRRRRCRRCQGAALRISAGGGSCGSVRSSSHSGFRGSAARANHKLLCVWEARRLVLLYSAADMLRLHYVTLPLLQGRGPRGAARTRVPGRAARAGLVLPDPADSQWGLQRRASPSAPASISECP